MASTIHDIFIRKILHLNPEEFTRYVEDENSHRQLIHEFVSNSRESGAGVIVMTRKENLPSLNDNNADGIFFISVEYAADHFITDNGIITKEKFLKFMGKFLAPMIKKFGTVKIYSEMKDYLWEQGHSLATASMEELWRQTSRDTQIFLLSAYHVKNLSDDRKGLVFHCIKDGQSHFLTKDELSLIHDQNFSLPNANNTPASERDDTPTIMDVLTAEICHEARNPLTIIKTSSEIIRELYQDGTLTADELEQKLKLIEKSVERIDHILTLFGKRS
ncbi:MAG: histidine kinase dimerization/phospho-acceptor domain-containing protein [Bdellovibrionota bacterium]